jgi:hypothetical protein
MDNEAKKFRDTRKKKAVLFSLTKRAGVWWCIIISEVFEEHAQSVHYLYRKNIMYKKSN